MALLSIDPVRTSSLQWKNPIPVNRGQKDRKTERTQEPDRNPSDLTSTYRWCLLLCEYLPPKNKESLQRNVQPSQAAAITPGWFVWNGALFKSRNNYPHNQRHVMLGWPVAASQDAERRRTLTRSQIDFSTKFIQRGEKNQGIHIRSLRHSHPEN